jgi:hypothetical protein
MTSQEQQLILGVLDATERVVMLADALSKQGGIASKEDAERLRQEIEKIRALTETARNHLRILAAHDS